MDIPLGKVSCRRLRSQPQVPFTESPSPAEELCQGRGLLRDCHPALLSASHDMGTAHQAETRPPHRERAWMRWP